MAFELAISRLQHTHARRIYLCETRVSERVNECITLTCWFTVRTGSEDAATKAEIPIVNIL